MKVLLVDDDVELTLMLKDYLRREGLDVVAVRDGKAGLTEALSGKYMIVVLDAMMPRLNGLETLKRIRTTSQIPVLMLTAKGDEADRITGLELGADDYVPKPCTPRELTARIRAILRRTHSSAPGALLDQPLERFQPDCARRARGDLPVEQGASTRHGGPWQGDATPCHGQSVRDRPHSQAESALVVGLLTMWPERRQAEWDGRPVELTSTEFNLLEVLARSAGHPVSKNELSEHGLGRPLTPYDRNIDVHLSSLRRKLGILRDGRSCLQTVYRLGYQFIKE
jgi:two-component system OmpR family response regulator